MQRCDQLVPVPILLMCHIQCFMIGRTTSQSAFGGAEPDIEENHLSQCQRWGAQNAVSNRFIEPLMR